MRNKELHHLVEAVSKCKLVAVLAVAVLTITLPVTTVFASGGYAWAQATAMNGISCYGLAASTTGQYIACAYYTGDIMTSNDYGQTWVDQVGSGVHYWHDIEMSGDGKYLVASDGADTVSTSSDYGATWTLHTELGSPGISGVAVSLTGQYMVGLVASGVYFSTDYGATWSARPNNLANNQYNVAISDNGQYITIADSSGTVYVSNDHGYNWVAPSEFTTSGWYGVAVSGSGQYMLAGGNATNIYRSDDYGQTWVALTGSDNSATWYGLEISDNGQHVIAIDANGPLYESADGGQTFTTDTDVPGFAWESVAASADASRVVTAQSIGAVWVGNNPANVIVAPAVASGTGGGTAPAAPAAQLTNTGIDLKFVTLTAALLLSASIWVYRRPTLPRRGV